MTNTKIRVYNDDLIKDNISITIQEYTKNVMQNIYNKDISYIDELLNLMVKDEIHIHHSYLIKYGIIKGSNCSNRIKEFITLYGFEEGNDYRLSEIRESNSGGCTHRKEYYFHPDAFGIILMRSKNTKEFSHYYNICQICIKHHSNYQLQMKQSEVSRMTHELKKLTLEQKETNKKLDKSTLENKITNEELKKSNKKLSKIEDQNDELLDKVETLEDDNQLIKTKLNISTENSVVNPKDKSKLENFIICKSRLTNPEYKYYVIRCQQKYTSNKLSKLKKQGIIPIFTLDDITNATKFWKYCKEELNDNIEYYSNNFNIVNLSEDIIIEKIKEYYNNRKNIELLEESEEE
jgi:hypothetical protein